jgi:hypothetical protein
MANHALESMSREAIEEYLAISHDCITTRKPNGGAYGYPAVLLLFSVVDALSSYASYAEHSFGALKDFSWTFRDADKAPEELVSPSPSSPSHYHARNCDLRKIGWRRNRAERGGRTHASSLAAILAVGREVLADERRRERGTFFSRGEGTQRRRPS